MQRAKPRGGGHLSGARALLRGHGERSRPELRDFARRIAFVAATDGAQGGQENIHVWKAERLLSPCKYGAHLCRAMRYRACSRTKHAFLVPPSPAPPYRRLLGTLDGRRPAIGRCAHGLGHREEAKKVGFPRGDVVRPLRPTLPFGDLPRSPAWASAIGVGLPMLRVGSPLRRGLHALVPGDAPGAGRRRCPGLAAGDARARSAKRSAFPVGM